MWGTPQTDRHQPCDAAHMRIPRRPASPAPLTQFAGLLVFLAAALGVGFGSSVFTVRALPGWYRLLRKPRWTPPDQVFGPVWTALYIMMAVAGWLVWRTDDPPADRRQDRRLALGAWWVQLGLNAGWTATFFGRRSPLGGLLVIAPLWVAIAATIRFAWRTTPASAGLLLPYLAWTTFAAALNGSIWQLNRRHVGTD
jgi:translocator protein